jgi:large subunit ribosomal protein L18
MIAQIIDDTNNASLVQLTTGAKEFQAEFGTLTKSEQCRKLGSQLAELAKSKGIESVVFDRGGYIYHGRVQALAESAREAGLQF